MRFWDASAVVAILTGEPEAEGLLDLLSADPELVAWWGTPVECASALSRLERAGGLSAAECNELLAHLSTLADSWTEVQPTRSVRAAAARLLRVHPLRAADSLQLAAAVTIAAGEPAALDLVCLDARLSEAARREGFRVIDLRGNRA